MSATASVTAEHPTPVALAVAPAPVTPVAPGLVTQDGTRVEVTGEPGHEVISVRDGAGALVFEHRAGEHKSVVYAPAGDLEFRAARGSINLVASDGVRVRAGRDVDLEGEHGVRLATPALGERPPSSVVIDPRGVNVATPMLDTRALRAEFAVGEARLVARTVSTAVETARHVVGVVETQATRIVERAHNVYRDVKELSQTRAGRMRLVAETTFHLLGRRTLLKAEEDMKIKGEKIHLA